MPCIWGQHNNSQVFLNVGIIDASTINPQSLTFGSQIPPPQMFKALVDTGAQRTMISTNVVRTLNLTPVGKIGISGVGSSQYHNGYLFHVVFVTPMARIAGQVPTPGNPVPAVVHYQPMPIYGAELDPAMTLQTAGFDVLLGMDVICTGSLKIEGNGTFSFSF
jgi:hypothetical protein